MQPHEILEGLSKRGYALCLLYGEGGMWIVKDSEIARTCWNGWYGHKLYEDDAWYPSITEAVNAYLKETGEEL